MMKLKELKELSAEEKRKLEHSMRADVRDARFKVAHRELKDVASVKKMKKTIARLMTLLGNQPRN